MALRQTLKKCRLWKEKRRTPYIPAPKLTRIRVKADDTLMNFLLSKKWVA